MTGKTMRRMKQPSEALAKLWKDTFMKDAAKFMGPTFLEVEDFHGEFTDTNGEVWKILGSLAGREMACEKIATNEIFIWDRWEVSLLKRPERHAKATKTVEITWAEKKKKEKEKEEIKKPSKEAIQLNLFKDE
jgi:hypothetical protein